VADVSVAKMTPAESREVEMSDVLEISPQPATSHSPKDAATSGRPDISIYWKPGCTNCLRMKEFLESTGLPFEALNVVERDDALEEITREGFRSVPVLRKGSRYIYAQSIDDVADHIGVTRGQTRLANDRLLERWLPLLRGAIEILEKFSDDNLREPVIPSRNRSLLQLWVHVFQIIIAFRMQLDEGLIEIKPVEGYVDPAITNRTALLAFAEKVTADLERWIATGGGSSIPQRMATFYGEQESGQVLERAVWQCAQHIRQLDIVAAGRLGAEFTISPSLYEGLPLPKRLWV
jgi:glutaredoxin